jgi:hypothetical protein
MSCFPQCLDLVGFMPSLKCLMRRGEGNKLLEVCGFGMLLTSFPIRDRAARDPQSLGQPCLCQLDRGAQGQHELPECIIVLSVRGSLHT